MFQIYCVDTSKKWINNTKKKIPNYLKKFVKFTYSNVQVISYNGEICHIYKKIPDINPEFIYLDGPHPLDPIGKLTTYLSSVKKEPQYLRIFAS